MNLYNLAIAEASSLLRKRKISSVELTLSILKRIEEIDPVIQAYLHVCKKDALASAVQADQRIKNNENITPLTGIPFCAKDCISTKNVITTCASKILQNYIPTYDATVIEKLKQAGAVLIGKNNMDEFGMGSSCENSAFFNTKNPWHLEYVPGGSSGGSAAAVAAKIATFALGEDTGGSVRMPAAFCGVVGLKPTYGRVSRHGVISLVSSLDTVGIISQNVADCANVFNIIADHDNRDGTSLPDNTPNYTNDLNENSDIKGIRIGIPQEYFVDGLDDDIRKIIWKAIGQLQDLGAKIEEVSLPHTRYIVPTYYLTLFAESSSNLARFDGIRFGLSYPNSENVINNYLKTRQLGFGKEVKRRIMLGTFALSLKGQSYYAKTLQARALIAQDFNVAFADFDALITPVCPTKAFKLNSKLKDPLKMYLPDIYVPGINLAGIPALSILCGFSQGLPVGMQIIGNKLQEKTLFKIGHAYQMATNWHKCAPAAIEPCAMPMK